jgi:hypothetical protein
MEQGKDGYGWIMAAGWRERAREHTACTRAARPIELTSKCLLPSQRPVSIADQIVGDARPPLEQGMDTYVSCSLQSASPPETETRAVHVDRSATIMAMARAAGTAVRCRVAVATTVKCARARASDPSHTPDSSRVSPALSPLPPLPLLIHPATPRPVRPLSTDS